MALSKEQLAFRQQGIGGSDATRIMKGDWHSLWMEKTGRAESDDLSNVLPVQLGSWTEEFNRQWFQKQTETTVVTAQTENLVHPENDWMRANLDGYTAILESTNDPSEFTALRTGIWEGKHVNQFRSIEECVEQYYAQVHHYMMVTGEERAVLSVLFGNLRWEYQAIEFDKEYADTLFTMESEFWSHVTNQIEPVNPEEKKAPRLDEMKVRKYSASPDWVRHATAWKTNRSAVKEFKDAEKELKSMMGEDVRTAFGDGIYINRAKNGALSIREMNEHKAEEFEEKMDDEY